MARTYISLFSSAGVGCYGFKLQGFECVATNELLEPRIDVQKANHKCKYENGENNTHQLDLAARGWWDSSLQR